MPAQRVICTSVFLWFTVVSTLARVVFSDSFSYPDGPLVSVGEGAWKTHSGTAGQVEVMAGQIQLRQKNTEDVNAPFAGGPVSITNASAIYARFKVVFNALPTGPAGTYFAHFKDGTATTGLRCRISATTNGAAAGAFRVGIAAGGSAASAMVEQDLSLGTPYQIVCRMVLENSCSTLWLSPVGESDPGATSTDEAAPKVATAFAFRESSASGAGMGELTVDDLVVATTFSETVTASAPVIDADVTDQTVVSGGSATFRVQASGSPPLVYQWFCNDVEIPGEGQPILSLFNIGAHNVGVYRVLVSNSAGSVMSADARLAVDPAQLHVTINFYDRFGVQLEWAADPELSYSVWTATELAGEFSMLAEGLVFTEGTGQFQDGFPAETMRFYRVGAP